MVDKLKKYEIGDSIKTKKWNSPFIVEEIYKGWVVAVNRKNIHYPIFLFIQTYKGLVYHGSVNFMKYGLKKKTEIKPFLDQVISREIQLEQENCVPFNLILAEEEFNPYEKREQVHYN